ncbi:MAG: hypothetical protein ACREM1_01100 [Longimicrobiales bacterium]
MGEHADTAFSAGFLRGFGIKADLLVVPHDTYETRFRHAVTDPSFVVVTADDVRIFDAAADEDVVRMANHVEQLLERSVRAEERDR